MISCEFRLRRPLAVYRACVVLLLLGFEVYLPRSASVGQDALLGTEQLGAEQLGAEQLGAEQLGAERAAEPQESGRPVVVPWDAAENLPAITELEDRLSAVEADPQLDDDAKATIKRVLGEALAAVRGVALARETISRLETQSQTAAERRQNVKDILEQPATLDYPLMPESAGVEELRARRNLLQGQLAEFTKQLEFVQETIRTRREEQQQIPQAVAELRTQIDELQQPRERTEGTLEQVWQAAELARRARVAEARANLALFSQRLMTYEAEADLLPLQVSDLERRMALIREQLDELSVRLSSERKVKIANQIATLRQKAEGTIPGLPLLEQTFDVLAAWPGLVDESQWYDRKAVELQTTSSALKNDLEKTKSLVESDLGIGGGLSQSVGFLLQRKRTKLPDEADLTTQRMQLLESIESAQTLLARVDTILDDLPAVQELGAASESYRSAIMFQREVLQAISADAERLLLETLIPLGVQLDTFRVYVGGYRTLINENLLWVRSSRPFQLKDVGEAWRSVAWLYQWRHWKQLGKATADMFRSEPVTVVSWLIVILLLYAVRPWFSRRLTEIGEQVQKRATLHMKPTFEALAETILLALPLAMTFGLPGRLLLHRVQSDSFVTAFADGLVTVAAFLLPLEFLRQFIRPSGIATSHFGWPPEAIRPVRQAIRWVLYVLLPLIFFWRILEAHSEQVAGVAALARIVFTVLMGITALLLWRVAHPRRGAAAVLVMMKPNGWVEKLRWVWHPLLTLVPVGLAVLMLLGYGYSATQLAQRLYNTIWIFIVALALFGLAVRWLTISRRRLAIQQLRERQPAKGQSIGLEGPHIELVDDKQADLSAINQQSRRLLDAVLFVAILVGLYYTWSPVLPALGFLERVTLWQQLGKDGVVLESITLANVLLAIPILGLTFILVRNAPGLLETTLLQSLPLENAVRYAITTISSYTLAGVGIVMAAGTLGLHWSSIQWLIAGLGVGLGFGLQEIFANFISGIILLFEQPIRVGDIVTLDGTTGVVSRIRMRATTITNWDRQEFVVPNKDFITGRLVNWTLTDTTNRVVVNVGIAYGSDTRKACEILQQICDDQPEILKDPAPLISFEGFGDSTLNIVLRFYLATLDRRLAVTHEVHTAINDRFNEAGLEIAFPQRDIHIRSLPESFKL